MKLKFSMFDKASGGFSFLGESVHPVVEEFDELLDLYHGDRLSENKYVASLERLIAAQPQFLDAHAHLAIAWYNQGKSKKALDAALAGLAHATPLIPEHFNGRIEWACLENRPFLRAMHLAVLGHVRLRHHRDAVTLIERMLAYNPGDNQGVRYLLGSAALRAGETEKARKVFHQEAPFYPPYYYELALSHFIDGEKVEAATAFRHGFCGNPYIAEILCGNPEPRILGIWHASNYAHPEAAFEYFALYGGLWDRNPGSNEFVRWLFNHPKVMLERAAAMSCQEALRWEREDSARGELLARLETLRANINDVLSREIIVRCKGYDGMTIYPWSSEFMP